MRKILIFLTMAFCLLFAFGCTSAADSGAAQSPEAEIEAETDSDADEAGFESADEYVQAGDEISYTFRNEKLLNDHYEKHGIEMGFSSAQEYEAAASAVISNLSALHKVEEEDGDDVYYVEETNEFVVLSTDGYIRTYFLPDAGKAYFDRQ